MAYSSTTEYINRDKFYSFSGRDLDIEFLNSQSDNPTRAVSIFCQNIQTWFYTTISNLYDVDNDEWDDDTFSTALNWQMKYILIHGEDGKIDNMAYTILHEAGIINPSSNVVYNSGWF